MSAHGLLRIKYLLVSVFHVQCCCFFTEITHTHTSSINKKSDTHISGMNALWVKYVFKQNAAGKKWHENNDNHFNGIEFDAYKCSRIL